MDTFADLVVIPKDDKFKLSDGWLTCFKARNGLKDIKRHGEARSSGTKTVENKRKQVQGLIKKYGYELHDIFNLDEMGLFYGYTPDFMPVFALLLMLLTHRMLPDRGGLSDAPHIPAGFWSFQRIPEE